MQVSLFRCVSWHPSGLAPVLALDVVRNQCYSYKKGRCLQNRVVTLVQDATRPPGQ